jgi:hypothetical protein
VAFLCLFLIGSTVSCSKNISVEQNNYLDEGVYGNKTIRQLLQLTKDQNIEYAGRFIDKDRMLNILLVYHSIKGIDLEQLQKRIDIINSEGKIKIQNAQFSYTELESAYNVLTSNIERLSENGLVSVEISEDTNRVTVVVQKLNDEIRSQISNIVNMSLINIKEGNRPVLT